MSNEDGFILVKVKRGKKRNILNKSSRNRKEWSIVSCQLSLETLIRQIRDAVVEFKESPYKTVLINGLSESLQTIGLDKIAQIICYGLGNFSCQRSPKYQLAALLNLKSQYQCDIYIYDPLFNQSEIEVLKLLDLNVITENEEGKRSIDNKVTLLFAVHCCKQLLNNFLYANWNDNINNCIIYGNSWHEVVNDSVTRELKKNIYYFMKMYPYVKEIGLHNNFEYYETFSSSSLHVFPKDNLRNVDNDFWSLKEEPRYQNQSIEFVKKDQIPTEFKKY